MTVFVEGAFDEAVLADFGRRIIVREYAPGVSMVDVLGVEPDEVALVLRESGAAVVERPELPAPPPSAAPPVQLQPVVCGAGACEATPCAARPCQATACEADTKGLRSTIAIAHQDLVSEVRAVADAVAAIPVPEPAVPLDLTPVLDAVAAIPTRWADLLAEVHALRAELPSAPADLSPALAHLDDTVTAAVRRLEASAAERWRDVLTAVGGLDTTVSDLRADVELIDRASEAHVPAPVITAVLSRWHRYAPWLGGAGAALLVELVARLH